MFMILSLRSVAFGLAVEAIALQASVLAEASFFGYNPLVVAQHFRTEMQGRFLEHPDYARNQQLMHDGRNLPYPPGYPIDRMEQTLPEPTGFGLFPLDTAWYHGLLEHAVADFPTMSTAPPVVPPGMQAPSQGSSSKSRSTYSDRMANQPQSLPSFSPNPEPASVQRNSTYDARSANLIHRINTLVGPAVPPPGDASTTPLPQPCLPTLPASKPKKKKPASLPLPESTSPVHDVPVGPYRRAASSPMEGGIVPIAKSVIQSRRRGGPSLTTSAAAAASEGSAQPDIQSTSSSSISSCLPANSGQVSLEPGPNASTSNLKRGPRKIHLVVKTRTDADEGTMSELILHPR